MRSFVILVLGTLALSSGANAQSPAPALAPGPAPSKGYVEGVAQSSFGTVTSQSYGGEFGVTIIPGLQAFVDAGRVRNAAPSGLGATAATIANALQTQFTAKEPITFAVAGARFLVGSAGAAQPYLLVGGGVARVRKDVAFTVGGTNVTATLQQPPYNTVLGSDLSGSTNSAMLALGGGVAWSVWHHLVIDLQYRYGRVFASDQGINVNRAGVGIGVRF
jgi:opacity protein-like surface antigen